MTKRTLLISFLLTVIGICYSQGFDRRRNVLQTNDSLPHNIEVYQYDLKLTPYFNYYNYSIPEGKQGKFEGEVSIHFSVINSTRAIEINSKVDSDFLDISIFSTDRLAIYSRSKNYEGDHEIIRSFYMLEPGINYTLNILFSGLIHKPDYGAIYSYEYVDKRGRNTALLSTQFQSIQAREAFPCFDDPFFKSKFVLSLVHPINSTAYSNAKVKSVSRLNDNQALTVFEPSAKMPTYLFAFAIGDFAETIVNSTRGVTVRSLSIADNEGRLDNAAKWAAKSLDYMEDYLRIPYPLDKLDHIETIEHAVGAMENFGLATYRDQLTTLIDNELIQEAENNAVICHETAHQWFGNLVTNKRWGLEFLHEAFAVYFQFEITKQLAPVQYYGELFHVRSAAVNTPKFVDKHKHPIANNQSYFDGVTYYAGGQLIYNIATLTGENFKKALTLYQKRYAFRNADLDNLLEIFDEVCGNNFLGGQKFSSIMRTFFVKAGLPKIRITLAANGDYLFVQKRSSEEDGWNVPLIYYDLDTNDTLYHLLPKSEFSTLPGNRRYLFNPAHSMYADVFIDESVWDKTLANNTFGKLSGIQQLSVLHHLLKTSEQTAVKVLKEHAKSINSIVYPTLPAAITTLKRIDPTLLEALLEKFDFTPTIENRIFAQALLVLGVHHRFPHIVNGAQKLFDQFIIDCAPGKDVSACTQIPPEFRPAVYFQGTKTEAGVDFLQDYENRVKSHKLAKFLTPELKRLNTVRKYRAA